jgi:hypothetical protein
MILFENKWIAFNDAALHSVIVAMKKYNTVSVLSKPLPVEWNLPWS